MPDFISLVPKGLVSIQAAELQSLGAHRVREERGQALFEANWDEVTGIVYKTRISSRIIHPILDFEAYDFEELYNFTQRHDFTKYITPEQTLAVDCEAKDAHLKNQQMITLKIKDAVVDQFWKKYDRRPNVAKVDPDLKISARVVRQRVSLALDLCGSSLSRRGYRTEQGTAPLRENLAYGLLALADWEKYPTILDPMCGSGTILIEAAMAAQGVFPGDSGRNYALETYQTTGERSRKVLADLRAREKARTKPSQRFFGFDRDPNAIRMARANAKRAGVENLISFEIRDIVDLPPVPGPGLIITNPPYADRMGERNSVFRTWKILGDVLHNKLKGWQAWILCGDEELSLKLNLKASRRAPIWNADIECRLLHYEIRL